MSPPPSLTRRAVSGVLWLGLLNSTASLFVLGLWSYLNRAMGDDAPAEMGLWQFVLKLLLFTNLVFEGGFTAVLKQRRGLGPGQVATIGRIQAALGIAGGALLWLLAPRLAPLFPALPTGELTHLLRLCAPVVAIVSLGLTPKALIERELSFRRVALVESSSTMLFVGLGIWLGARRGAEGLVIATLVRHGVETLLYWGLGPLRGALLFARSSWEGMAGHLRFGASILAQGLLGNLLRHSDVLLAGILLTDVGVGLYAQLQLFIALPLSKISMYALRVAFPTFASVQDAPERLLNGLVRMQRLTALTVFPALAGLVAVGPRLFSLYLGPEYDEWLHLAWPALLLLCGGAAVYTYAYGVAVVCNAVGRAHELLLRQLAGVVLVVGSVSVAGQLGFLPLAAGRSVAVALAGLLFLHFGRRVLGFGWRAVAASLRAALPAAVLMGLAVASLGLAADALWPASDPFRFEEGSRLAVAGVLLLQLAAGAASYLGLLRFFGYDAFAEGRELLGRRRAVAEADAPG